MVQMLAAWPLFAQTAETLATGDSGARGESPVQLEPPPQSVPEAIDTVYGSLTELWRDFLRRLPLIFVGVMILFVTWFLARVGAGLARRATRRMRLRTSLQELFGQIAQIGIWFTGIIVAAVIVFP